MTRPQDQHNFITQCESILRDKIKYDTWQSISRKYIKLHDTVN